ncbi:MAG: choice-of-anchor V domain-containing protein [Kofleriaceae bacterium]
MTGGFMRIVLVLLLAGFHTPASFDAPAGQGGGNRMYFDGSPRQRGYDCTICHTDPPRTIRATVTGGPSGAYAPGQTYTLAVALEGAHAGFGTANDQNGFVAELVDDRGATAGALAASDGVELVDDGRVVAGEGERATTWTFAWTAPVAGLGAITLHLGMVDGNGAATAATPTTDPGGDDVATLAQRWCEGTTGCAAPAPLAPHDSRAIGCAATSGSAAGAVLVVLASCLVRRRRRVVLALVLAGCFDPTTPSDCPDHVCGLAGSPDGGGGPACAESWQCTSWATNGSDAATRTCTDLNQVGTTSCKPAETATLPALDLQMYKCEVHPIFQRGCGMLACHGDETAHELRIYTRGRWRNDQVVNRTGTCIPASGQVNLQTAGSGTVMCEGWLPHTAEEWRKSFDSSRSFMLGISDPEDSLLVREPTTGGLPHAQVKLFTPGDPDYQTLVAWLGGATYGATCNPGKN